MCLQVLNAQKGKTGRKTQRSSNSLHGADSDAVNLHQSLGGLWLTGQDSACKTNPASPEPESTWPGAAAFMALLCSTATTSDCFAGQPHREMEDSVPAVCLWDRISREGAYYRHLNPS